MRKAPKKRKGYQTGTPAAGVTEQELDENGNPVQKGNFMSGLGNSMGWFQYANMAQQGVRSATPKETITDPDTGEVYSTAKTKQGKFIEAAATPAHETWMNNYKEGDYKSLAQNIFLTPAGGNLIRNKGKIQDLEYEKKKAEIEGRIATKEALEARDQGQTMTTVNSGTTLEPEKKNNLFGKISGQLGLAKGGEVQGKGGPKSDSINAEIEEGSFVVPAEHSDVARMLKNHILKKSNKKANLHQGKDAVPVKLSNEEYLFSPEEKEELIAAGVDLDELAPHAESATHFKNGGLTPEKAAIMLHEGYANKHKITDKQRKFFAWKANSKKQ